MSRRVKKFQADNLLFNSYFFYVTVEDVASKNVTFDKINCGKSMHILKFKKLVKLLMMSALNLMEVPWKEIIQEHNSEIWMYLPIITWKVNGEGW